MRNILFTSLLVIIFASCTNIYFTSPQPEFAENLSSIPDGFQGTFYSDYQKDSASTDSLIYHVTDVTINGDTINTTNLVVRSWGNYLFVNTQDEEGVWDLMIVNRNNTFLGEEIKKQSLHTGFGVDLTGFNVTEDTASGLYILNDVSTLQFHYLLRMSNKNTNELNRID